MNGEWTLAELSEKAGVPARTIRYYIARGLMEGPAVAGRGAVYNASHLERLKEIRKLQGSGRMLGEIARGAAAVPEAESWLRHTVANGVVLEVRADLAPWRLKRIRKALVEFARQIQEGPDGI